MAVEQPSKPGVKSVVADELDYQFHIRAIRHFFLMFNFRIQPSKICMFFIVSIRPIECDLFHCIRSVPVKSAYL